MNKEKNGKESLNVYDIYESSEAFRDAVEKLSAIFEEQMEQILVLLAGARGTVAEQAGKAVEDIAKHLEPLIAYVEGIRPPSEIKKELKYTKKSYETQATK